MSGSRSGRGRVYALCALLVVLIGLGILIGARMSAGSDRNVALRDCEQRAQAVCEGYGLQNVSATAAFRQTQYILYCDLTVSADGVAELEFQDQYELVKKLEAVEFEYDHWSMSIPCRLTVRTPMWICSRQTGGS